jgi:hypothetical protein
LGATAGAAGGAGALGLGALAGAATGAGLNAGKAAIKGDQDIGMAAAFGAGSGALGGLGGAAGVGGEAAAGNVAEKGLESTITNVATPTLNSAAEGFSEVGKSALEEGAKSATENSLQGGIAGLNNQVGSTLTSQAQNAITPSSFAEHLAPTDALNSSSVGLTAQGGSMIPGAAPGASTATAASLNPFEQSFAGLKDTITNPMQHQGMLAAQVGAAGLEDQYKQQGLNEQASAKQANEIVGQYRKAGIMPSELPKGLTDIANRRKSFAAGGTIRDVQGLGAIPTGYINQQPMQNFYPQSMIPQAQPLQSTQPIRHEVIGYADGGQVGYGYAEGGDVGGGDEGLLHGPGTGQSDGIAGLIEGAQSQEPVRLADSEFVIPADVVSALGSGSTKAGAQALYDMLDRIRQQAYGHIQQTNPVDPSKVLPA